MTVKENKRIKTGEKQKQVLITKTTLIITLLIIQVNTLIKI